MYADIVVLTYQAPAVQTFTYEIPKELEEKIKIGQLVSVPFGKRNPMGIITGLNTFPHVIPAKAGIQNKDENWIPDQVGDDKKRMQIKPIISILFKTPILLPYQIELLKWMAAYYHASMVNCLEAMLPDIPKRSVAHPRGVIGRNVETHPGGETGNQTLVLVPSINRLPETLAMYPQAKNHVVYHAEQKITERFDNWLKILSGNTDYIFGSRSAIFTPCPNLKKIIIYDEHDGAYKDERSPYYDTLTIAEKINQFTGAEIKIIDSAPRITTYFAHKPNVILDSIENRVLDSRFRGNDKGKTNDKTPNVKIFSMLDEKAAGNRLPISDLLAEYLKAAAIKQKSVLLFLNKKVGSGHVYCRNCKYSEFALKHQETCPNCQSADIWFNSLNISSLANLVRKIVPASRVNIVTKTHPRGVLTASPGPHPGGETSNIDVATALILYKLTPAKYDLVAHIATDTALNISDITSSEKVYEQITDLKRLTKGLLLLQTYNPNHLAIRTAEAGNYQKFYENQLSERKALTYPPFSILVKLILRGKDENLVEEQAQRLYEELSDQLSNYPTTQLPTILGPYKPFFSKAPRYNIILKFPTPDYSLESRQKALEKMRPYFSQIPKKWQIVIEPDTIL